MLFPWTNIPKQTLKPFLVHFIDIILFHAKNKIMKCLQKKNFLKSYFIKKKQ